MSKTNYVCHKCNTRTEYPGQGVPCYCLFCRHRLDAPAECTCPACAVQPEPKRPATKDPLTGRWKKGGTT
jgi:hypothetical protein